MSKNYSIQVLMPLRAFVDSDTFLIEDLLEDKDVERLNALAGIC